MDSEDEGSIARATGSYRYKRKNPGYFKSVKKLRKKRKVFGRKGRALKAFYQKRRILLAGGASPDTPEFGVLEATVRFGVDYTSHTLGDILLATLAKLVHENGNGPYEVG